MSDIATHFVIVRCGKIAIKLEIGIADIVGLDIIKDSAVLMVVRLTSHKDFLIECYKRFEVIRYIHQACDFLGIQHTAI